jgi:hypothetical protein
VKPDELLRTVSGADPAQPDLAPQAVDGSVALDELRASEAEATVEGPGAAGDALLGLPDTGTVVAGDVIVGNSSSPIEQPAAESAECDAQTSVTTGEPEAVGEVAPPPAPEVGEPPSIIGLPADDLPVSYQSHFLVDEDEEPEFVAHVEPPETPAAAAGSRSPDRRRSRAAAGTLATVDDPSPGPAAAEPDAAPQLSAVGGPGSNREPPANPDESIAASIEESPPAAAVNAAEAEAATDPDSANSSDATPPRARERRRRTPAVGRSPVSSGATGGPRVAVEQAVAPADDAPAAFAAVDGSQDPDAPSEAAEDAADGDRRDSLSGAAADGTDRFDRDEAEVEAAADEDADEDDEDAVLAAGPTGGGWTIPLLCLGIAVIACCLIIPQADANRRLAYERLALRRDLDSVQAQVATNDEFLRKLAGDPTLAERLAQRQMKLMRPDTRLLPVGQGDAGTSPFDLVQVTPPAPMDPYEPLGGRVATLCYVSRTRLYLTGGGLFLVAAGLVLGVGGRRGE